MVPEPPLHLHRVAPLGEKLRGAGMEEGMEPGPRNPGLAGGGLERALVQVLVVERSPALAPVRCRAVWRSRIPAMPRGRGSRGRRMAPEPPLNLHGAPWEATEPSGATSGLRLPLAGALLTPPPLYTAPAPPELRHGPRSP